MHGTRGLFLAGVALLLLALLEPLLPDRTPLAWVVFPVFVLLAAGLATLPREGVAAQWRARDLLTEPRAVPRMARRLAWPALLNVLLLPKVFLALYGIPHLSPFTGLLLPDIVRRVAVVLLFVLLLIPILYLRSSRIYAPDIKARRPKDLAHSDGSHAAREVLLWMQAAIVVAWGWMTWPFWRPFPLLAWPPGAASFGLDVRGVGSIAFAIAIPVLLWTTMVAHLALLRDLRTQRRWRKHPGRTLLASAHVVLAILAIVLHAYNMLWIVRYRSAALF